MKFHLLLELNCYFLKQPIKVHTGCIYTFYLTVNGNLTHTDAKLHSTGWFELWRDGNLHPSLWTPAKMGIFCKREPKVFRVSFTVFHLTSYGCNIITRNKNLLRSMILYRFKVQLHPYKLTGCDGEVCPRKASSCISLHRLA